MPAHDSDLLSRHARGDRAEADAAEHGLSLTQWRVATDLILTKLPGFDWPPKSRRAVNVRAMLGQSIIGTAGQ
ncbi:MAG TPA: hypothetical protein DCP03_09215 [Polaromonas sp.]|nr:hypothetical protein [Polaromonas sp.]